MHAGSAKWCSLLGFVLSLVSLLGLTLAFEVEDMPNVVEAGKSYDIKWKGGSALVLVTYESPYGGRLIQTTSEDHYEWTIPIDIPLGDNYRLALHSMAKQVADHAHSNNFTIKRGGDSEYSTSQSTEILPSKSSIRSTTLLSASAPPGMTTSYKSIFSSIPVSSEPSKSSEPPETTSLPPVSSDTTSSQHNPSITSSTSTSTSTVTISPPTPIANDSSTAVQNLSKAGVIGISTGATIAGAALLGLLIMYLRRVFRKRKPVVVLDEFHVHPSLPELLSMGRSDKEGAVAGNQDYGASGVAELSC